MLTAEFLPIVASEIQVWRRHKGELMKRYIRGIAALISITFAFAACFSVSQVSKAEVHSQSASGTLKGIVVDWQYARVLNTKIILEGRSFKKEIAVDDEGAYEAEVPAGSYLVKAECAGFRQYRLMFDVVPGEAKTLNIMLKVLSQKPVKCPRGSLCL